MMIRRASRESALAISTSCCCAIDSAAVGVSGDTSRPSLIEVRLHRRVHLRAIDEPQRAPAGRFAPEQDVAGDVEIVEEVELLVDERDARARSPLRRRGSPPAPRRSAPRRHRAARPRRRSSSASTCRRRSRRAAPRPRRRAPRGARRAARARPGTASGSPRSCSSGARRQRPRSCVSLVLNSSTLSWRITMVGMNS